LHVVLTLKSGQVTPNTARLMPAGNPAES